ncbi:MAG: hypothetical protein HYV39_03085 [Candidatus Levybacteria bacterium]|nr:hypothetical protein [Candidatus Levybacteria bacterium]
MVGEIERRYFVPSSQNAELLDKIDSFVAEHREPYSIADAMRILGRGHRGRPPFKLKPLIREILVKDGITTLYHPEITEGTLRKICLAVGLPDPKMSEAIKKYWRKKGTKEKPYFGGFGQEELKALRSRKANHDISTKLSAENAPKVQTIIDDTIQNNEREIPQTLVELVRAFFENNPREHYLLSDLFDAAGKTRIGSGKIKRVAEMIEAAGIKRAWKTAPLLLPMPLAVAVTFEIGLGNPKNMDVKKDRKKRRSEQRERSIALLSQTGIQAIAQGNEEFEKWSREHAKGGYSFTDVAYALGYKGGKNIQIILALAREAAKRHYVDTSRQNVRLTPSVFADIFREVRERREKEGGVKRTEDVQSRVSEKPKRQPIVRAIQVFPKPAIADKVMDPQLFTLTRGEVAAFGRLLSIPENWNELVRALQEHGITPNDDQYQRIKFRVDMLVLEERKDGKEVYQFLSSFRNKVFRFAKASIEERERIIDMQSSDEGKFFFSLLLSFSEEDIQFYATTFHNVYFMRG